MPDTWTVYEDEGRAALVVSDEFSDPRKGEALMERVDQMIDSGTLVVEFDFSKTKYLASFGIAILIRLKKKLVALGGDLKIVDVSKHVKSILFITRADRILMPEARE